MKKNYVRPMMVGERFTANEYVAACGDKEYGMYRFKCDAGASKPDYNTVYYETNGVAGLQTEGYYDATEKKYIQPDFRKTGSYHACGKTHEAPTNDEFLNGYCITPDKKTLSVIIWTEGGTNVHCTQNTSRDSWETTKS